MNARAGQLGGSGADVYRPETARAVAVGWFVLAAVLLVDTLVRGDGGQRLLVTEALLLVSVVVYALAYRPAVIADDDAVTLRNIVRDVRVPWSRIASIGGRWSLELRTDARAYVAFASAPRKRRQLRREDRDALARVGGTPPPDLPEPGLGLTARLWERWEQRRNAAPDAKVEVRWRWDVIAPLVLLIAALALTLAAR